MVEDMPKALNDLIMDCIEFSPARRPAGLAEVRCRLDEIAEALGPEAS